MKKLNIFIWFISRSNIAHIGANVKKKLLRAWNWWSERGLNPQPDAYKAPALTIELSDHKNCSVFWGASYLSDDINPTVLFSHLQPHFHHLPPLSSFCILWHFIQLSHPIIISRSSFSLVSHIHLLIACTHFVCEWICQLRDYRKLKLYIVCVERTELTLTNITISQRLKKSTSFCTSGRFSLKFQLLWRTTSSNYTEFTGDVLWGGKWKIYFNQLRSPRIAWSISVSSLWVIGRKTIIFL